MITHYRTFEDINNRDIPNCEINAGDGVKAAGAVENIEALWVQLNKIQLIVVKLVGGQWEYYGAYTWTGAVAVKPDVIYDVKTDAAFLAQGTYGLQNFNFTTTPQTSGLHYQDGSFDLVFSR